MHKIKKSIAFYKFRCYNIKANADVVKLADTLDLGSSASACRFDSCHPHHCINKLRGIEVFLYFMQDIILSQKSAFHILIICILT